MEDLLAAVYFSNVKILSSVKIKKSKKKVHIKLPELDNFIHQTMIESARKIYSNPSLFSIKIYGADMLNKDAVLPVITEAIQEAIIKSLPFQNILQTYFGNKLHGDESSSEEESDSGSDDDGGHSDADADEDGGYGGEEDETGFPTPNECGPAQPQNNGFFDRPDEPAEVKEVPIQPSSGGAQNVMEQQNPTPAAKPVMFPDASDDAPQQYSRDD